MRWLSFQQQCVSVPAVCDMSVWSSPPPALLLLDYFWPSVFLKVDQVCSDMWSRQFQQVGFIVGGQFVTINLEKQVQCRKKSSVRLKDLNWQLSFVSGTAEQRSRPGRRASDLWWVRNYHKYILYSDKCFSQRVICPFVFIVDFPGWFFQEKQCERLITVLVPSAW